MQVAWLQEGLTARLADVRLFASVDEHMQGKALGHQEGLAARVADVRLLARVDQHVLGKVAGPQEGLAAHVADVLFFALSRLAAEGKACQEKGLRGAGLKEQA